MLEFATSNFDAIAVCESRIRLANRFTEEIDARLKIVQPDGYEAQELRAARHELSRAIAIAQEKLQKLPRPPKLDSEGERRRRINEAREAEAVSNTLAFVETLRAQGDHRQARIHLLAAIDHRADIERETA